ncbi:DENN domain-containing protein 1B [Chanos chanos]|uniref:DENN domain-containing protein 1B n=1 Tax=Chanos chanos TaxID=29144 RepID=A0A6J2VTA4_CHACN|nr:DENN domain-containing protein 1B-like [Chanos chanos]
MGSRLRENPDGTFYWFFEASCPIARDKDPEVLFQFPEDFNDEESVKSLPRFCFPYDIERVKDSVAVQHFTFVLTDLEGCQRFGFCRLTSGSQTCLCILSYLPWFEVFYKLLNNLADYLTKGQTNEMRELLAVLYKHPLPLANGSVTLQMGEQLLIRTQVNQTPLPKLKEKEGIPYFIAPDPKALPSIPESRNLTELVVAVDVSNLLQLYASMLFERRILIYCSKLSTLTACVHACSSIIYPMYWQHIFIPVLPPHLLDYCCAPMPYLIGVHSSLTEKVKSRALEDVVIFNVDTNTMESPFDDLKRIPTDVVTGLKVRLKKQAAFPGPGVARAFLRAQALLFGGYRDALQCLEGGPISFSEELFLTHKSQSMRQFLESAVHLQFFKQFIDERLELLNQGKEPSDLFEEEIVQCGSSAGSKSYQQWVGNLKKGGGALILSVKSKAHIYKAAKYHNRFGLKNLLSSKEQSDVCSLQRGGSVSGAHSYRRIQLDSLQNRLPITQHFGMSRPRRPARKCANQQGEESPQDNTSWEEEGLDSAEASCSETELQSEDPDLSLLTDPEEMDLLGEIFDTLSAQTSMDRGLLYSTRSLDLFGPDSFDFRSHRSLATPSEESLNLSAGNSGSLRSWEEGLEEGLEEGSSERGGEAPGVQTDTSDKGQGEGGASPSGLNDQAGGTENVSEGLKEGLSKKLSDDWPADDGQVNGAVEEPDQQGAARTETSVNSETRDKTSGGSKGDGRGREARNAEDEKEEKKEEGQNNGVSGQESARLNKSNTCPASGGAPRKDAVQPEQEVKTESDDSPPDHAAPSPAKAGRRGAESEPEQVQATSSSPRVLSTAARFQIRTSPTTSHNLVRTSFGGQRIQISPRGPTLAPQQDDPGFKSPSESPGQQEELPVIKVSELKKKFEM